MSETLAYLALCRIERGGFSGERVFHIQTADGTEYIGLTPVGYCHRADGTPLNREEPAGDEQIEGMVDVVLRANGGEQARIHLPDGETITVHTSQLCALKIKETEYVSVRP